MFQIDLNSDLKKELTWRAVISLNYFEPIYVKHSVPKEARALNNLESS